MLDQLPKQMNCGPRTLSVAYIPITSGTGDFDRLLVVMTDITDELARARMEHDNQEMMQIFKRASADRAFTEEFFAEAAQMVQKLDGGQTPEVEKRLVHTLTGTCAMFGIDSMVQLCHEAESRAQEDGMLLNIDRRSICARWDEVVGLAPRRGNGFRVRSRSHEVCPDARSTANAWFPSEPTTMVPCRASPTEMFRGTPHSAALGGQ